MAVFQFAHNNINVLDMEKSISFYEESLGLKCTRRVKPEDGSFELAFLEGEGSPHQLELTWLRDRAEPYNLGDNEFHLAFYAEDMAAARALHEEMGCVVYVNEMMGIYFIADPDGYWTEIIPRR
jgi:lactoylglutathione lyase